MDREGRPTSGYAMLRRYYASVMTKLFRAPRQRTVVRRKSFRCRPRLELLEQRETPASFNWQTIRNAFHAGEEFIKDKATEIVTKGLGLDLPFIRQGIQSLPIAEKLEAALQGFLTDSRADAKARLLELGFKDVFVVESDLKPEDNTNNLVEVTWDETYSKQAFAYQIGDSTGFDYFDNLVNGQLSATGSMNVAPDIHVRITFGVDVHGGSPTFFISDSSFIDVSGITGSVDVAGSMAIRYLADVDVSGRVNASLSGRLGLKDIEADPDQKIRLTDFQKLGQVVTGDIDGAVNLENTQFKAKMPLLGEVNWSGTFTSSIVNGNVGFNAPNLVAPNSDTLLEQFGRGFFSAIGGSGKFDFLGGLGKALNTKLPILNKTIGDYLGLGSLGWLISGVGVGAGLQGVKDALSKNYGISSPLLDNPVATVQQLINGDRVDLIKFETKGRKEWKASQSFPLAKVPVWLFTLDVNAKISPYAYFEYFAGLGVDTTGFYIDPRTHIGLGGGVRMGLEAAISLGGFFSLASFEAGLNVAMKAGVKFVDPDPSDGKIYLDELFRNGDSLGDKFLNSTRAYLSAEALGYFRILIHTGFFGDITVADKEWSVGKVLEHNPPPPPPLESQRVRPLLVGDDSAIPAGQSGGVLTIKGSKNHESVLVSRLSDDKIVVRYDSVDNNGKSIITGRKTFSGVKQIRFTGDAGNDRFVASDNIGASIYADGGAGDDELVGGGGNDTLIGGLGIDRLSGQGGNDNLSGGDQNDELDGGDGKDSLLGGNHDDILRGGASADLLDGGAGNDDLRGESGADSLLGGAGDDLLDGGEQNDLIRGYFGRDTAFGGSGDDQIFGEYHDDVIRGGLGRDLIDGGDGNDLLTGHNGKVDDYEKQEDDDLADGADTIRGGAGNDSMYGGAGNDLLEGQYGDDVLNGQEGTDTIRGGAGRDRIELSFGANDPTIIDDISGGTDQDRMTVLGSDYADTLTMDQLDADTFKVVHSYVKDSTQYGGQFTFNTSNLTVNGVPASDIEFLEIDGYDGDDVITLDESVGRNLIIHGGKGNDRITGAKGRDSILGGEGDDTLVGGEGDDILKGGDGNDSLDGGAGVDQLYGRDGADESLSANQTDDDIIADSGGISFIYGDAGDDDITGGNDADFIDGGRGDDNIDARGGIDIVHGGDGNDTILGGDMSDMLIGGDDNDLIKGQAGRDMLLGEGGNDTLWASEGDDQTKIDPRWTQTYRGLLNRETELLRRASEIEALLDDNSTIALEQREDLEFELERIENELAVINDLQTSLLPRQKIKVDYLDGGSGDDELRDSSQSDILNGGNGNDILYAGRGSDKFKGGNGDLDTLVWVGDDTAQRIRVVAERDKFLNYGAAIRLDENNTPDNPDDDKLVANLLETDIEVMQIDAKGGNDTIVVDFGLQAVKNVRIDAGDGDDVIDASLLQAACTLIGGTGSDTIFGGFSDDQLIGDPDGDPIGGNDVLIAGPGNDLLVGGRGDDYLNAGGGDDRIDAGDGNDTLDAGGDAGNERDILAGDAGKNNFRFTWAENRPTAKSAVGDFDGNGIDDMFFIDLNSPANAIGYRGLWNDRRVDSIEIVNQALQHEKIAAYDRFFVGDFNGDGRDDVAFMDLTNGNNLIAFARPNGVFEYVENRIPTGFVLRQSGNWTGVFVGDFDRSGADDFFFLHSPSGDHGVAYARGGEQFGTTGSLGLGGAINGPAPMVSSGDFNGDGYGDLFLLYTTGENRTIFFAAGWQASVKDGIFAGGSINGSPRALPVADFNGDGRDDLLGIDPRGSGESRLFYFYGDRQLDEVDGFVPESSLRGAEHILLGDFNGDSRADVFTIDSDTGGNVKTARDFIEGAWFINGQPLYINWSRGYRDLGGHLKLVNEKGDVFYGGFLDENRIYINSFAGQVIGTIEMSPTGATIRFDNGTVITRGPMIIGTYKFNGKCLIEQSQTDGTLFLTNERGETSTAVWDSPSQIRIVSGAGTNVIGSIVVLGGGRIRVSWNNGTAWEQ